MRSPETPRIQDPSAILFDELEWKGCGLLDQDDNKFLHKVFHFIKDMEMFERMYFSKERAGHFKDKPDPALNYGGQTPPPPQSADWLVSIPNW